MSVSLTNTIKNQNNDMDRIFAEVNCPETLGLRNPSQLRLFHLLIRDGEFYHHDLERWLHRNLSHYVFSRAKLEELDKAGDIEMASEYAISKLLNLGSVDKKGMGSELGEMLIYAFLEGKLSAPKLMSRVELSTDLAQYKSVCESIHMLSAAKTDGMPFNQMVFGTSRIVGDIRDAVDEAFESILRIKNHSVDEINMVEKTAFDIVINDEDGDFLKRVIIPEPSTGESGYDTAYGVFLGYTIGVSAEEYPNVPYKEVVMRKLHIDIRHHAQYIVDKINNGGLSQHSFYIYILPFADAETNKHEIMNHVINGWRSYGI